MCKIHKVHLKSRSQNRRIKSFSIAVSTFLVYWGTCVGLLLAVNPCDEHVRCSKFKFTTVEYHNFFVINFHFYNVNEYLWIWLLVILKLSASRDARLRLHMLRISLTLKNFFHHDYNRSKEVSPYWKLANLILKLGMMSSATQSCDLPKMTCIDCCIVSKYLTELSASKEPFAVEWTVFCWRGFRNHGYIRTKPNRVMSNIWYDT